MLDRASRIRCLPTSFGLNHQIEFLYAPFLSFSLLGRPLPRSNNIFSDRVVTIPGIFAACGRCSHLSTNCGPTLRDTPTGPSQAWRFAMPFLEAPQLFAASLAVFVSHTRSFSGVSLGIPHAKISLGRRLMGTPIHPPLPRAIEQCWNPRRPNVGANLRIVSAI